MITGSLIYIFRAVLRAEFNFTINPSKSWQADALRIDTMMAGALAVVRAAIDVIASIEAP
jgi:hypothetical protein